MNDDFSKSKFDSPPPCPRGGHAYGVISMEISTPTSGTTYSYSLVHQPELPGVEWVLKFTYCPICGEKLPKTINI